jgi:hypothetical protein
LAPARLDAVPRSSQSAVATLTSRPPPRSTCAMHLTAAGRAVVSRALADVEAADQDYFAALGQQRTALLQALQTLEAALVP